MIFVLVCLFFYYVLLFVHLECSLSFMIPSSAEQLWHKGEERVGGDNKWFMKHFTAPIILFKNHMCGGGKAGAWFGVFWKAASYNLG